MKKGNLSINSENIFPIIKKWLYSDHDIFIRELVSNACDAITKLKKLSLMGEYEEGKSEEYKIYVEISPKAKTISFIDNGIGMDYKEVDEYINQIAFSGAKDFLDKYKDKANEEQIIGHFGLGFYSAFMVADRVEIDTLSYKSGSEAVHWESNGGTEYEMSEGSLKTHGTKITLHLNDNSYEFSNEYRVREVLNKYCAFMPVSIYLKDSDAGELSETIDVADLKDTDVVLEKITEPAKTEEKTLEDGTKEVVEVAPAREKAKIRKREVAVNDTTPLWTKHPNECSDEDYKDFYRKVFMDYKEPLFWIHLNMDYPFNLKGILYFPKINTEYDSIEGTIKLYNNQVFIADNIKEVIPEFLMLLKGVIDCPDLPLNVSRSALQNDGFVKKISDYISKKVADKLSGMCRTDRENYEKYWDDIAPFIKFGCLKDEKFADKVKDGILFKDIYDKYQTFKDLELEFKDGMLISYNCKNIKEEKENKELIKEVILKKHDTLPMGEFAIGTNTLAYTIARKYNILRKLPILIVEKTGPHFALGDTCYSHEEDFMTYNPDGKAIVARENEISALRHEDRFKAYYNCHTDITIPYDEIEAVIAYTNKEEIYIIKDSKFALEGLEELNEMFEPDF